MPHRLKDRLLTAAPLLALLLLNAGFYWKLVLTRQYTWFDTPDMCYIEVPRLQMQAKELQSSRFPLWDPYLWSGQSLIGQTQPGPLFPLNLLLMLMPRKASFIQFAFLNAHYVLLHLLASFFLFRLLRDWGRSRWAAVFGGCLFAFSGFVSYAPWLDVLNGAILTPLIFLHLFRAVRGERPWANAALSGLWMGLAWLSGHHEIPLLVTLLMGLTWAWQALRQRRNLLLAALSVTIMALIGAAQLLPTYEFGRLSKRWAGLNNPTGWNDLLPYSVATSFSMTAQSILRMAWPLDTDPSASTSFVGIVGLCLAALGLKYGWSDVRVRWSACVAGGGLLYALGAATPLHGLLYAILPALEKARVPARALHLVGFGVALLAAYGVDCLLERAAGDWARRIERLALAFGTLIFASAAVLALALKSEWSHGVLIAGLAALIFAAALAAWRTSKLGASGLASILLCVAVVEWYGVASPMFVNQYDAARKHSLPVLQQNHDIAQYLRAETQTALKAGRAPMRVAVAEEDIPANFGDWHAIEVLQGYTAGVPANLLRAELHTRRSHQLFGVTHWIGREKLRPEQELAFTGQSGIKVWRTPDVLPRAWIAHEVIQPGTELALRQTIQLGEIDFRRQVVTQAALPPVEDCSGDTVRFTGWGTDRVTLAVEARCRGILVLADPYYPGWQATINGAPAPIHEVYGSVRGVAVPRGSAVVEFRFRPTSVYAGLLMCATGLLGVLLICLWDRRAAH
jgi:hypothetical protein